MGILCIQLQIEHRKHNKKAMKSAYSMVVSEAVTRVCH